MPLFDENYDFNLLFASFVQQYGINIIRDDITVQEYVALLSGISPDTPLGRVIQIRNTTDPKQLNPQAQAIRSEWLAYQAKTNPSSLMDPRDFIRAMKQR